MISMNMSSRSKFIFVLLIVSVAIGFIYLTIRIHYLQIKMLEFENTYSENIRREVEAGIQRIRQEADEEIRRWAERQGDEIIHELESRIKSLKNNINQLEKTKETLEKDIEAKLSRVPEIVSLDDLGLKYESLTRNKQGNTYFENYVLSFETDRGIIAFKPSQIQVARIPSNSLVAWVRIGKSDSTEDAELIKAWLEAAEHEKKALGYKLVYARKRSVDYGEVIERKYGKGDLYFKTYFRYARVQGTYGRFSLEYTYYIEWGSAERKKQYYLETYNMKIGS